MTVSTEWDPLFGLAAPSSGWVPAPRYAMRRARVLDLLGSLAGGRSLEIGCGAGAMLADLARLGWAPAALETSPSARALARELNPDPAIDIAAEARPEWTGAFDLVLCFEVLEHIADDGGALRSWRELLRPGGHLLLSVPARQARWTPTDEWSGHLRRYERRDLLALVAGSGYAVERHECYGFPLSNVTEPVRGWVHGRMLRRERLDNAGRTERSGSNRGVESRLWGLQKSWPSRALFRLCCRLQERVLDRELGTGYLVLARRSD